MQIVYFCLSALGLTILCCACGMGSGSLLPRSASVTKVETSASPASSTTEKESGSFSERVLRGFFPYREGPPRVLGIVPGVAISQSNWQVASEALSQQLLTTVQNGELTILVQETSDLPVTPEYMTATIERAQGVTLDESGNLVHYYAGLPFPLLDPADPQAGLKAAWNARHADSGDIVQRLESLEVRDITGEYQYGFSFAYSRAYGMHRTKPERNVPAWEDEDILYKEFIQVLHPAPAITIHPLLGLVHLFYWHDHDTRPVNQWYVTGFLSINRLRTLVYDPGASAWRFPLLYEDLFGSYLHAYQWRLLSTRVALVPGFVHGTAPLFGGQRAGYPLDPWELRTVYIVEAVPRNPEHPYGRKVFYFDQQTFAPLYVLIFDHQGKQWRTGFFLYAHPTAYPGAKDLRVPILIGRSWIDFTADRATLALVTDATYNQPLSPDFFTPANMIRKGK